MNMNKIVQNLIKSMNYKNEKEKLTMKNFN